MVKIDDEISRKLDEAENEINKLCGIADNIYSYDRDDEIPNAIDRVESSVSKIISDIRILIGDGKK